MNYYKTIIKQKFHYKIIIAKQNLKLGPNMGLNVPTPFHYFTLANCKLFMSLLYMKHVP